MRKRVEEIFGLAEDGGYDEEGTPPRPAESGWVFTFALAAYNLVKIRTNSPASTQGSGIA